MSKISRNDELIEQARLLATPIDFEAVISEGIIEKRGDWYAIRDPERLPAHAWKRGYALSMGTGPDSGVLVKFTSESKRKAAERLYQQMTGQRVSGVR